MRTATALPLTMGTPAPARRRFLSRSAVSVSAGRSCRWTGPLEAEIFRDKDLKRCAVCGGVFVPKSNGQNTAQTAPPEFTGGRETESERKRRSAVDS